MTRITYKKENGLLINRNDLIAVDKFIEVELYCDTNSARIYNKDRSKGQIGPNLYAKNLPALKKAVKKELESLGVNFTSEVRPRVKLEVND